MRNALAARASSMEPKRSGNSGRYLIHPTDEDLSVGTPA